MRREVSEMKVVVAMDSLKGSLTSMEAGNAVKEGILRADGDTDVAVKPLADGGEGTVEALVSGMGGRLNSVQVTGPLGKPVLCEYGILQDGRTAILEMSGASGITLLAPKERNPLYTTTYGVGEVIRDAIEKGCRRFLVGIGGSATNDGGIGMLQALGYGFLDENGRQVPYGARGLADLARITGDAVLAQLKECSFRIACDVKNPLYGKTGCSAVFGPQKGADPEMILQMDQWMEKYARLAASVCAKADPLQEGTGAAGGLGFAFLTFTNAVLESGINMVLEETGLQKELTDADLVITGEGRLDGQTAMGKAPAGVAELAKKYGKPVVALAGSVAEDAVLCNQNGIDAFFPIIRGICSLEEAMEKENAKANMASAAEQMYRLWLAAAR